ncbi:MAG TPA: type III secretion system outer membrane ring subunit SctC [Burkholderiaceae bacterium]|nr:type III secretion system outer membrane ring subunit SctC [Burkholderiaceae bacterium]
MRLHLLRALCVLAALGPGLAAVPARSASLNWNTRLFSMVATEKPLADFLRELAASQGTTAVIDPKVSGTLSGKFQASASSILNSLCATNGLTWYHDGAFLFIEPAGDARTEVLAISGGSGARIAETLDKLRITDSRYPLSISEREGTLYVSGPKRYVEMVRQAVKLADQRAVLGRQAEIRVFPLRHAWAADVKINRAGGKETTVPGVVSVLRGLHPGTRAVGGSSGGGAGISAPVRVGPNRVLQLSSGETVNAPKIELGSTASGGGDEVPFNFSAEAALPQFHADTRLNAVMVRDLPERMPQHARLIEAMDARPQLVELELTIMDINSNTVDALGVDWRLHGPRADFQGGGGSTPPLLFGNAASEIGQTGGLSPAGGVFTAAIGHEARTFLLTRVSALAQSGNANFIARPKVLTLNNTEAILENLNELHVRVDGFQDAALFSITAGTALRITPMMLDEGPQRGVMLSINIEDADLDRTLQVDRIPVVRRRAINTQALVDEGTSLLIAGYSSEEKTDAVTGVPLLSKLPVLGQLFRFNEKRQVNMERFYLLTPRLVTARSAAAALPPMPPGEAPAEGAATAPAPRHGPAAPAVPGVGS